MLLISDFFGTVDGYLSSVHVEHEPCENEHSRRGYGVELQQIHVCLEA